MDCAAEEGDNLAARPMFPFSPCGRRCPKGGRGGHARPKPTVALPKNTHPMRQHHQTRAGSPRPNLERHGVRITTTVAVDDARIALIASTFHDVIVDRLTDGALTALIAHGIRAEQITFAHAPGAWELPQLAERIAHGGAHHAIVALGCVIRGETSHYEVIVNESAHGLMHVALMYGLPVANGVLACENEEQALARAGGNAGNQGAEAAEAALQLLGAIRAVTAGT